MEPIITYSEVTLTGKRKYELYADKIVTTGKGFPTYEFEQTLALTKISPDYIKLRTRPVLAWAGLLIFFSAGLLSVVLVVEFAIQSSAVPGVLAISSVAGLIIAIATMKKVEYARFCSEGYGSLLLSVARSGPEANRFDSFVQALVSQIGHAKQANQEQNAKTLQQ